MIENKNILLDETPIDVTAEANFIWSIANKLRGVYMPDKYGDVIIPMVIIRRFECTLEPTKDRVVAQFESNPNYPEKAMYRLSGYQFYNTSRFNLKELCNDADHIAANFKEYIAGFSKNVQDILHELEMDTHIKKMDEKGCLYSVIKAFSELDLYPETYDSIKMGYIFENLIGRFFQNIEAGQFYTGRDIIKLCVSLLIAEGCDDIFDDKKIVTICDQACGTGGMLSTAYSYIKQLNPTADVKLFGQEYMGTSYAIGLAEMLIKGQNADNFRHTDTLKNDCFPDTKMRFLVENPPFGCSWGSSDAKDGQEKAVKDEFAKGFDGRWGAGLPGGGDAQLLFMQSAIHKMDDNCGRAAIISNGSPLFTGGTSSGESQIRRWMLEEDLIEAIIQLPTDSFYNTGISTYIWVLSKNKRPERKGKVQLIDASAICHKLRKPMGNKKNEFLIEDRAAITKLYADFVETDVVKIFDNTEFMYREYSVMQPMQRSYAINAERIEQLLSAGGIDGFYDYNKVYAWENSETALSDKDTKKLEQYKNNEDTYNKMLDILHKNMSDTIWYKKSDFENYIKPKLSFLDNKTIEKLIDIFSKMDKNAEIQKDKKGNIIYDKSTKDIEIVKYDETIDDYMTREVLPHVSDAQWFWEEDLDKKTPVVKTGAEIPFTRYFYKYQTPASSEELMQKFLELDVSVRERIERLFNE